MLLDDSGMGNKMYFLCFNFRMVLNSWRDGLTYINTIKLLYLALDLDTNISLLSELCILIELSVQVIVLSMRGFDTKNHVL